jgi:hypothetical protein
MERWSEGIYLLGLYGDQRTGCWMLINGPSAAIIEMPPYNPGQYSPTIAAQIACEQRNILVEHLLCTHAHEDHIAFETLRELHKAFPAAKISLQSGFKTVLPEGLPVEYFDSLLRLDLSGEPVYLVHAPKHSWTDTMVIFKGMILTGDWELNTIRSIHDEGKQSVPARAKLKSIETLSRFPTENNYIIHGTFSSHATECRNNVDFGELMEDTKVDRRFW